MHQHAKQDHSRWMDQQRHAARRSDVRESFNKVQDYDNYDAYDRYDDYSGREYTESAYANQQSWQQQGGGDVYENVQNTRNLHMAQQQQQQQQQGGDGEDRRRRYDDYDGQDEREVPHRQERRERVERPVENRQGNQRRSSNQAQQIAKHKDPSKREPHLRFEPSPVPYLSHKHEIIDGFQSSPNKHKFEESDHKKKNDIPPAPPGPAGSIRAIINNLKGNNSNDSPKHRSSNDDRKEIPRNKVSTNPFLRNGEKMMSSNRGNGGIPEEPVKNVQEVVQKMNSGDWPIKIEDEPQKLSRPRSQQGFERPDKARQWETLDRRSPEIRHEDKSDNESRPPKSAQRSRDRVEEEKKKANEVDHYSERSDSAEQTSVSTDSAMVSDEMTYNSHKMILPFELPQGTILRKLPDNVKELNDEAEKLLLYFKGHRPVLNYLGIGLSETLWTHIYALPTCVSEIHVSQSSDAMEKRSRRNSENPQILVTQPPFSPSKRMEKSPHESKSPRSNGRSTQVPNSTSTSTSTNNGAGPVRRSLA